MELSYEHKRMLIEESGIAPDVMEARGYRTVEKKAELKRIGFSEAQCGVPGLLIPIRSPAGEIVLYQYRPDSPRIKDGKPVKYETPSGSRMAL
ncbi:MAG: virulence-associated protein E, partial [Actinobacteria bacterium]